jgi:hypothetical protein
MLIRISCIALVGLVACSPAFAQARQGCLHGAMESRPEEQRRTEALTATHIINTVLARLPRTMPFPTWEELANSPRIAPLRGTGGAMGDIARKMLWGTIEPLPGWLIHYLAGRDAYAFSLRDSRDPCGFGYASDESGVIVETYPVSSRVVGIVPLETR